MEKGNQRADPGAVRSILLVMALVSSVGALYWKRLSRGEELVHQEDGYVLGGLLVDVVHPSEYVPSFLLLHPWAVVHKAHLLKNREEQSLVIK